MPELLVAELDGKEMAAFNQAFAALDIKVADRSLVREKLLLTVKAAKAKLKANFVGAYPGGAELGWQPIRPEHWSGSRTWGTYYFASAIWLDHVIAAKNTLEDHFSCVWEWEEAEAIQRACDLYMVIGPYTLPIMNLRPLRTSLLNRVPLPEPVFITEKQTVDIDINFDVAPGQRQEIRPIGVVVSTGANLTKKRPT